MKPVNIGTHVDDLKANQPRSSSTHGRPAYIALEGSNQVIADIVTAINNEITSLPGGFYAKAVGDIADKLIGEDSTVEKEYLVRVTGELSDEGLRLLNHGLRLDGVQLKPAKVSWQNEDQLRFVLREGRKRQIRRMCELVGLHVTGLKRVRIGSVTLGKLPPGQWRYLRPEERF